MSYYDGPGRARKQCPSCKVYCHVRLNTCKCGHVFKQVDVNVSPKVSSMQYVVKTADAPSRGRKQCDGCKQYVGVRTLHCPCGYTFPAPGEKVEVVHEKSSDYHLAQSFGYGHYTVVLTPAGQPPVKLKGNDEKSVKDWAEEVMVNTQEGNFYGRSALVRWIRETYPVYVNGVVGENPEYTKAVQSLDGYLMRCERGTF